MRPHFPLGGYSLSIATALNGAGPSSGRCPRPPTHGFRRSASAYLQCSRYQSNRSGQPMHRAHWAARNPLSPT
jgi:hypothetical protein